MVYTIYLFYFYFVCSYGMAIWQVSSKHNCFTNGFFNLFVIYRMVSENTVSSKNTLCSLWILLVSFGLFISEIQIPIKQMDQHINISNRRSCFVEV